MKVVWVIYVIVDDPVSDGLYDKNLDFESGAFASAEEAKKKGFGRSLRDDRKRY